MLLMGPLPIGSGFTGVYCQSVKMSYHPKNKGAMAPLLQMISALLQQDSKVKHSCVGAGYIGCEDQGVVRYQTKTVPV